MAINAAVSSRVSAEYWSFQMRMRGNGMLLGRLLGYEAEAGYHIRSALSNSPVPVVFPVVSFSPSRP